MCTRRSCHCFVLVLKLLCCNLTCSDFVPEALGVGFQIDDECSEVDTVSCAIHALQRKKKMLSRTSDGEHLDMLRSHKAKHSALVNATGSEEICCMCHRYDHLQHKTIAFSAEDYHYGEGHDCFHECEHECAKKHGYYWGCFDEVHMIHLGLLVHGHPFFRIEHDDRPGDIC
eukprot:TRINITY_DN77687_c0_g1_i1.p1 TRINITY_DN77687_c0_g1~~TRINITY_DN77687_c0_g1_i1.p1  ORF type:complete len:172 (-),score=15.51 TRINITY_DN77687_c0_g1_i1:63-578(-)